MPTMKQKKSKNFFWFLGVVVPCIIFIVIAFATGFIKINSQKQAMINAAQERKIIASRLSKITWALYHNKAGNYTIKLPNLWQGTEKHLSGLDSYVTFTQPTTKQTIGSILTTSIAVQTDPNNKQELTTQDAFDTWYKKPTSNNPKDGQRFHKLNTTMLNGAKGVILLDSGEQSKQKNDNWSLVTWFRKDKTNYYINTRGSKKLSLLDLTLYDAILSSFQFGK